MSVSKRRLSSGNGLVGGGVPFVDEDEDDEEELDILNSSLNSVPRRQSGSGRRGSRSFMGAMMGARSPPMNPIEQNRIAEMYKTVIQMSSENKLNEKNSWNFDLIDHMGKLIKDEGQGVNFQKASCTLDASVKIYSNRVDDTYTSSHRILESLSRNGNNDREEDDGDDDNNDDSGPKVVKARVGTKANSDKLNLTSTIEKNVSALNVVAVENDYHVDPMFVRMSQAFDEGGAKGMLMYNMRLQPNSCSLSFDCKALKEVRSSGDSVDAVTTAPVSPSAPQDPFLDLGDLVARAGLSVQDLCALSVCPPLDDYRQAAGVAECLVGLMDPFSVSAADHIFSGASDNRRSYGSTASSVPVSGGTEGVSAPSHGADNDMDMMDDNHDDYNDYGGDDGGDNDYEEPSEDASVPARQSTSSSVGRSSVGSAVAKTKLNWDLNDNTSSPAKSADIQLIAEGLESLQILSENYVNPYVKDYSVFDVDALISNNTWAGARHWKYATRRKEASSTLAAAAKIADAAIAASQATFDPADEVDEEEAETTAAGKKRKAAVKKTSKTSKEILPISFTLDLTNEAEFELPAKNKRDTSLQTAAALEKASSPAEINALLLPYDSKLQLKDLCRLFLAPKVIVPPAQFHSIVQQSLVKAASSSSSSRAMRRETEEEQDFIWGQRGVVTQSTSASRQQQQVSSTSPVDEGAGDDFYDDNNDDGGGWDDDYDQVAQQTESSGVPLTGLEINQSKLLQAGRIVEKIQIDYAKKSKLVNIQRLKMDIWAGVDNTLHIDEPVAEKKVEKVPETLSFQHLISDIAADPRQKDVSISFYFICLLHLANEHGLQIEDREDMADLVISKGGM